MDTENGSTWQLHTHTHSQTYIESCAALQLPLRKVSRTNNKAHPHSCLFVQAKHVQSSRVIFHHDKRSLVKILRTQAAHIRRYTHTQTYNQSTSTHQRAQYGVPTGDLIFAVRYWVSSFLQNSSCFFTAPMLRWQINILFWFKELVNSSQSTHPSPSVWFWRSCKYQVSDFQS